MTPGTESRTLTSTSSALGDGVAQGGDHIGPLDRRRTGRRFLYAAYVQDIELSDTSRRPAIRARVTAIRTHHEAVDYMREVGERASRARKAQTARIAS